MMRSKGSKSVRAPSQRLCKSVASDTNVFLCSLHVGFLLSFLDQRLLCGDPMNVCLGLLDKSS